MRLSVLDRGHALGTKLLFAFIRAVSRQPTPDPLKLVSYRPKFYGNQMKVLTQEAMRGPSSWLVAERELMAAHVSNVNRSVYCIRAHSAVSGRAYRDEAKVSEILSDVDHASIAEPLRETLRLLGKLVRERSVTAEDVRAPLASGASPEQIRDAFAVAFAFNATNRLADTFDFAVPGPEAFRAGAKYLLARGYK
jgi:AhpD family alkylhydroperoxidase